MGKKIVATFDDNIEKIEFYEVIEDYKEYTIIRKQGKNEFYAWNNKESLFSDNLHIICTPTDKEKYEKILDNVQTWYIGAVFFWANSKFVTEYGNPNYSKLIGLYKELLNIKRADIQIKNTLQSIRENEGLFNYLKCIISSFRFLRGQRITMRKLEREFKLIW